MIEIVGVIALWWRLSENDRDRPKMDCEFEIAMSLSSGSWHNMKKKDRSEQI